jgi:hypothetical protein
MAALKRPRAKHSTKQVYREYISVIAYLNKYIPL